MNSKERSGDRGQIMENKLYVVIPCYNEEENVPIFYEEMMKNSAFLEQEKLELEIIYIDDGSKDRTAEIADAIQTNRGASGFATYKIS